MNFEHKPPTDDELNTNPPTPCRICKRPPAPGKPGRPSRSRVVEGRPRVGVRVPCRSRGADSLPQHEGGDGQASAGSPPRRRGRLGLAGRRWRRLRRWEGSWVVFRRGRVGSLLMLLLVRPLALATRHTRRGTGSYKGRRGRRSGRSHNTIARAGNSRALFESVASRSSAGGCSARGLSGPVGGCSRSRRRSSRV